MATRRAACSLGTKPTLVCGGVSSSSAAERELTAFVAESPIQRRPIVEAIKAFAATVAPGSDVLDAGAGDAPYRRLFVHCNYRTQDWPASPHTRASTADIVGDLRDLPVAAGSLDAVVCTEVLEHIETPWDALDEIHRVLRPGGRLFVTVPFVGELHEEPHDHYRYTSHGIRGLLERSAFVVDNVEPLTGYFQTMTHLLRIGGTAFRAPGSRSGLAATVATFLLLALSKALERPARLLDRIDNRHALPIGWVVEAHSVTGPVRSQVNTST